MPYDPQKHHRQSIRLKGFDYRQPGAYFVSICVDDRECLFGQVMGNSMQVNEAGSIVRSIWESLPSRFSAVALDAFVVMPNHVHGIVILREGSTTPPGPSLGGVIRVFKSISAIQVNRLLQREGRPLWQRNYYERVVRDVGSLSRIQQYIQDNPARWDVDPENPSVESQR